MTDVVLVEVEVEKFPNAPKARPLEETEPQARVISESYITFLRLSLTFCLIPGSADMA